MLESLFNKVSGLKACNFIHKILQHRCFPVKFGKFLRTPLFTEHGCCYVNIAYIKTESSAGEKALKQIVVVSATRRRRDIKIPLYLSAPVRKSLI